MEQMKDRLKKMVILSLVLTAALVCRLAYIQLAGDEELSGAERSQSLISLPSLSVPTGALMETSAAFFR